MYNIDSSDKQPYSFGVKNIQHRVFNETPAIKRQIVRLIDDNNVTGRLLTKRETFVESESSSSTVGRVDNTPKGEPIATVDDMMTNIESFKACRKEITFNGLIDSILSFILTLIFLIFCGYMLWICVLEDRFNGSNKGIHVYT